ncbi:tetratricopeptide repeat protein [Paraglaciecola sp. L3A3]|uniref:tetratricopeptide repeat protein n=1 Tax=Paraglaciecola sp. L3A3 TaxID=2686358 RepID=UPI00131AB837|nr:tetratricopeptide repeat protein [Paraglaciecola sp. L3A3]
MKKYLKHLCAVSAITVAVSVPNLALAQAKDSAKAKPVGPIACPGYVRAKTNIPGQKTGKKVGAALDFYNLDQVDEALKTLLEIETDEPFDRAFTDNFIGKLLAGSGKGKESLKYFVKAVNSKQLNDVEQVGGIKLIADLNLQEGEYEEAIKWYKEWLEFTCKEDFDVYFRMANAYYQTQQYAEIIPPINKAIALAEKPNKTTYALKMTSYYSRKMYKETIEVQEEAVKVFPDDKNLWTQLGMFYMLVEDHRKALSTFELAYHQGFITKAAEIRALSQLYTMNDIPIKAAQVLEKHVKSGFVKKTDTILSSIGSNFQQAKEFKEAADYYGQAADMTSDPSMYFKQGNMLYIAERPNEALKALQKSLDEGADNKGRIHMVMMEANFYQGRYKQAYEHIQEAKKDPSTRRNARSWESFIKEKAKNNGVTL